MGKITRRGTAAGALALAGALAFGSAAAANIDGSPIDIDGDPEVSTPDGPDIYRFADRDRVGTAIQAAERTDLPWGETVILANSAVYADALAASPLADAIDAPVLLNTPGNSLNNQVATYLAENDVSEVLLVGGTDVFGNGVRTAIEGINGITVDRVEGANRYQTALQLAERAYEEGEYGANVNVFLASGTDFADALSAGPAAAANDGVVLLTNGSDRIDRFTYEALTAGSLQQHESIIAIGGPAAAAAASGHQGDPIETNHEIIGDDRYETAVQTADEFIDTSNFVVASGQNFPDAVVGGAYAANVDGALLLTREAGLSNATGGYLEDNRLGVDYVFVFGGPDSVAPVVSQQIADLDWRY